MGIEFTMGRLKEFKIHKKNTFILRERKSKQDLNRVKYYFLSFLSFSNNTKYYFPIYMCVCMCTHIWLY